MLVQNLKRAIKSDQIIVVVGPASSGKTRLIRRLRETLRQEDKMVISKSLCVEKEKVKISTLMTAMILDLTPEKDCSVPSNIDRREHKLRRIIQQQQKPIALFADDAHLFRKDTLGNLKKLLDLTREAGATLSVVLAGRPSLLEKFDGAADLPKTVFDLSSPAI